MCFNLFNVWCFIYIIFYYTCYLLRIVFNLYFLYFSGAVALDGRIEPGDMILQVNDINFENMSNDQAVRVLRDVVQTPG